MAWIRVQCADKLAGIRFDLGDHPAGFRPAPGLIGEVRIGSCEIVGRATYRALEEVADPFPARRE